MLKIKGEYAPIFRSRGFLPICLDLGHTSMHELTTGMLGQWKEQCLYQQDAFYGGLLQSFPFGRMDRDAKYLG